MTVESHRKFFIRGHGFDAQPLEAGLYIVSTPIGNLADITIRALETLAASSVIACEDTRTSGILLKKFGIESTKVSYTEHNAETRGPDLLRQINEGAVVSLISDAGTPLISDPGSRLAAVAVEQGIKVVPIPGASAPLAALVGSGLGKDDFRFCGFLPTKQQARQQRLSAMAKQNASIVFFESPRRIVPTLEAMAEVFGPAHQAVVARELTKLHETFHRGSLSQLICEFQSMDKIRGEIVIVVDAVDPAKSVSHDIPQLLREALETMKTKQAANHVADLTGKGKQELYRLALSLKSENGK